MWIIVVGMLLAAGIAGFMVGFACGQDWRDRG